jgi:hypothetical protein
MDHIVETDPYYEQTRCIIGFIQLIFSKRSLGNYKFIESAEDKDTEIVIAGIKALKTEFVPRIIVARGVGQSVSVAMDNLYTISAKTGATTHKMLMSVPFSINVIARIDAEAQEMAWYIQQNILAHRATIRKVGGFHKIDSNISITPPTDFNAVFSPEIKSEGSLVQVGFGSIIPYSYTIAPNDKVLLVRAKNEVKVLEK